MLTAKYKDTQEVLDITKFKNPRAEIDKTRLVCRFCDNAVSVRQGIVRARHFYHLQACTSDYDRHPESAEHNLGKELVATHVKQSWSDYAQTEIKYEYPVPEIKRIADIAMVFPSGWVVVHEIQLASITNEHLQKRTNDYNSAGIDVIWWLGKSADTPQNRRWCFEHFGYSLALDFAILAARAKDLQVGKIKG